MNPELRERSRRLFDTMCGLDGMSFAALRDELEWPDNEVQACLAYLNSQGYVAARVLSSLQVRYNVTELGWSVCELLAKMDDSAT